MGEELGFRGEELGINYPGSSFHLYPLPLKHQTQSRATIPRTRRWNFSATSVVVSMTSACEIGAVERPQARFVMQLIPTTRISSARAVRTSGTVDIPIASAPRSESIRTSAGVS